MLIYVKKKENVFHQTHVQLKTIVRNLTKTQIKNARGV
jgi:hypothetical protein